MKAIIGKNSSVVKKIHADLTGCEFLSHKDMLSKDLNKFDVIFLFSWSHATNYSFIESMAKLPMEKVVFVSTLATYSLQYRRQWAKYPILKKAVEEYVANKGGKILRIGSVDKSILNGIASDAAITDPEKISDFINSTASAETLRNITEIFDIRPGNISGPKKFVLKLINAFSDLLPNSFVFQAVPAYTLKRLGIYEYSYTRDSNHYFRDEIQIGYGALGSVLAKKHSKPNRLYLVSGEPSTIKNDNGFSLFKIGREVVGLSKYWHGVKTWPITVERSDLGVELTKSHTLKFVKRPHPPKSNTNIVHVANIKYEDSKWKIVGIDFQGNWVSYYSNKLILAAGPFENLRLLSNLGDIEERLDDDENAFLGKMKTSEAISAKLILRVGPLIFKKYGIWLKNELQNALVDFRPYVASKQSARKGIAYYLDFKHSLILKILLDFSFDRINEAFFNKFGFAIYTKYCSVFAQALYRECIEISCKNGLIMNIKRNRISDDYWITLQHRVMDIFNTFEIASGLYSIDGLHVKGGIDVRKITEISSLLMSNSLIIAGTPNSGRVTPFHTTRIMQEEI